MTKIPDKDEHERAFIKRLNTLRKRLRTSDGELTWVETTEEDGAVVLYLTKPALTAAGGPGTKKLRLERPNCENCHQPWVQHAPPGGKCLFSPTSYDHD
jgi:hypothetical protein